MKPCEPRWREELLDHALGSPATATLAGHLAKCSACSAALRLWKANLATIDANLGPLAGSEPAPHSISRIMAEVRNPPRRAWWLGWNWQAAAASAFVVVLVFAAYGWNLRQQRQETQKLLAAASSIGDWKSPTGALLRSTGDRWLNAPPQFGGYFYKLETTVPAKEKANP